ncbi:MAG: HNH endonuclease [Phycisphaerae bacterium]
MDARIRQLVRERAERRCEYCRFPESALPYLVFHVDHIIAKQHMDEISDDPELLAWACSECNYHKGPNLVSIDSNSKEPATLFDPRREDWNVHFRLELGMVIGLTPAGRATARLLNMNAPRLVRLRRELVEQGIF